MKLYIRNFDEYNDVITFNPITFLISKSVIDESKPIKGYYKKLKSEKLLFYRFNAELNLFYMNEKYGLDNILNFKQDEFENVLTLKSNLGNKISIREDYIRDNDFLTITDEEDYNFLKFIYNISKRKERQEIVFNTD
jgi:hypothetical protein